MKLRVVHTDGRIEVLSLVPPFRYEAGHELEKIVSAEGMVHFFDSDGFYDGWERVFGAPIITDDPKLAMKQIIAQIDEGREFPAGEANEGTGPKHG